MNKQKLNRKNRKLKYIRAKNKTRGNFKNCDPEAIVYCFGGPTTMNEMWKRGFVITNPFNM